MGWVRFGGRIGLLFLGLAAVAPLAITSDAADGRRHRDVHVQNVHHSGLVHHRAHATSPAAAPSAVRTAAQLEGAQSTINDVPCTDTLLGTQLESIRPKAFS
jgi:hypothetical protein